MDIFGGAWENYVEQIEQNWRQTVGADDLVLIAGDISWAMSLEGAKPDLDYIGSLPGKKVLLRGNHDYWWKSISAVRAALSGQTYAVQNDALRFNDVIVAGSRGWTTPERGNSSPDDKKIYDRELIRMELSLTAMQKLRGPLDKTAVMIHYPPFDSSLSPSPFTDLFTRFNVDAVIYGHLHGKDCRAALTSNLNGVSYYLTSCDQLKNTLVRIF
jgi:predicted phosphohydrolase